MTQQNADFRNDEVEGYSSFRSKLAARSPHLREGRLQDRIVRPDAREPKSYRIRLSNQEREAKVKPF